MTHPSPRNSPTHRSGPAHWGVVALAMGSPATPEEVEPFLEALFADPAILSVPLGPLRRPLARLLAWRRAGHAKQRYGLVGGSPLVSETRKQVAALAAALEPHGLPVTLAMTYTQPDAEAAVSWLRERGVRRLVALPLFPQRSDTTSGSGLRQLRRVAAGHGLHTREIPPYPRLPGLVEPLAAALRQQVTQLARDGLTDQTAVLLTAHGLPERNIAAGDPYVDHVRETAAAVREAAGVHCPVHLGFQSRIGPVRWVGPQVEDQVDRLARTGIRGLVVVPITFVCEHLETRYDLDLELRAKAWAAGITRYHRVPAVGDHPDFIASLADHVLAQL